MPWVDNRELAILDIMAKLQPLVPGTITTLDRNPMGNMKPEHLPAVLLFEGPDIVTRQPGRNSLGPQERLLTLVFELWYYSDSTDLSVLRQGLRSLYNDVRKEILSRTSLIEKSLTSVFQSPVPGVLGVGMNTELRYINNSN